MAKRLIVIMGPSACGKSSVASALAELIPDASMIEADDHHSPEARAQMASGKPLCDADREPWVQRLREACVSASAQTVILACSALTPIVQQGLRSIEGRRTHFVMLAVEKKVLAERLAARSGHFMPASLLDSQFEALHLPKDAVMIDANRPLAAIAKEIAAWLDDEAQA